jgi:hypothetical protein
MKVALHMRARRDAIDAYLSHVVESDNYGRPALATLASMAANAAWRAHMGYLIDFPRDCSAAGADRGLPGA